MHLDSRLSSVPKFTAGLSETSNVTDQRPESGSISWRGSRDPPQKPSTSVRIPMVAVLQLSLPDDRCGDSWIFALPVEMGKDSARLNSALSSHAIVWFDRTARKNRLCTCDASRSPVIITSWPNVFLPDLDIGRNRQPGYCLLRTCAAVRLDTAQEADLLLQDRATYLTQQTCGVELWGTLRVDSTAICAPCPSSMHLVACQA